MHHKLMKAKQIVEKAVPYIENAITFIKAEKPFPIPTKQSL